MTAPTLRDVRDGDGPALARLVSQLGYPATEEQVLARLEHVRAAGASVTIAEIDGRPVGLLVAQTSRVLTRDEPVGRLALLVTDEEHRGRGIGRALVRHFEEWARQRGAVHAALTSATHREAAHGFYRACGWTQTGIRLGRDLQA